MWWKWGCSVLCAAHLLILKLKTTTNFQDSYYGFYND